jgi:AcrR family transcriptional regulator
MVGRPRSIECDHAILDAALSEYATRGLDGMSVDAVAARAGVSKATIYRRFASKVELVIAAASTIAAEAAPKSDTGALLDDLTGNLNGLAKMLSDPVIGAAIRQLVVDSAQNAELQQMHRDFIEERRVGTRAQLRRAVERGELRPNFDLDFALDELVGPLFYRHLMLGEYVDQHYVDELIDAFVARYGTN